MLYYPMNIFLSFDTPEHAEEARAFLEPDFKKQLTASTTKVGLALEGKINLGATSLFVQFDKESEKSKKDSLFDHGEHIFEDCHPELLHLTGYPDDDFAPEHILLFFAQMIDRFYAQEVSFGVAGEDDSILYCKMTAEQRRKSIKSKQTIFSKGFIDYEAALNDFCSENECDPDEIEDQGPIFAWSMENPDDFLHEEILPLTGN